jgi:cytochrome c5
MNLLATTHRGLESRRWLLPVVPVMLFGILSFAAVACGGSEPAATEILATPVTVAVEPTEAPAVVETDLAGEGEDYYAQSCVGCHGTDAKGITGIGKDLTTGWVPSASDDEVLETILRGRDTSDPLNTTNIPMPPKGGNPALSSDDVTAILAFLRSIEE